MSDTEFLVVVFGLFIGYWIVSQFASGGKTKKDTVDRQADTDSDAWRRQEQAKRETDEQCRQQETGAPACWYDILNVSPNADAQEIRRAYQKLMSQYHPDKVASLGPELRELCERKTKDINAAYDRAMAERGTA